jgi:hypothetical protein
MRLPDQGWPDDVQPLVSVAVPVYNQEEFVRQTLNGILAQETTFRVEVIVHDDASTDRTVAIVKEYEAANPGLFRVIVQPENQLSRGKRPLLFMNSIARGKYLAVCEGDDFWTAPDKLESQIHLLEERPDASGSIHKADGLFEESGELEPGLFRPPAIKPEYGIDELLVADNFVPTGSIVLRRRGTETIPSWIGDVPHGDISILSHAALSGPLLYIDRSMSVYRKHLGGIHSREGTAKQALNCIATLVGIGSRMNVVHLSSFQEGMRYRIGQVRTEVDRYEARISELEMQLHAQRDTISQMLGSRTFKIGIFLTRLIGKRTSGSN